MRDIIYTPFHCSNLGSNLARFPVCYKEQLWCEIKHISNSPGKSNYRFKLHVPRCGLFTVDRVTIQPYPEIYERFIFVPPIFAAQILGKIFNCHRTELCIYKTGLTRLLTAHGSCMVKAPYSLEKWVIQWHGFDVPTLNPQIPCSSKSNAGKMVDRVEVRLVGVSSVLVLWHGSS